MFRRAIFDTSILIDWMNRGLREELILGRASFVNDVLIALTCREIGATFYSTKADDLGAIRAVRDFALEIVPAR